jgi:hypothetical protein
MRMAVPAAVRARARAAVQQCTLLGALMPWDFAAGSRAPCRPATKRARRCGPARACGGRLSMESRLTGILRPCPRPPPHRGSSTSGTRRISSSRHATLASAMAMEMALTAIISETRNKVTSRASVRSVLASRTTRRDPLPPRIRTARPTPISSGLGRPATRTIHRLAASSLSYRILGTGHPSSRIYTYIIDLRRPLCYINVLYILFNVSGGSCHNGHGPQRSAVPQTHKGGLDCRILCRIVLVTDGSS